MLARSMVGMALAMALAGMSNAAEVDLATAFGARSALENVRLSPDGSSIAYTVPRAGQGDTLFTKILGKEAPPKVALSTDGNPNRLGNCNWVTDDRLICTVWGTTKELVIGYVGYSRIMAVDADGSAPLILGATEGRYGGQIVDYQTDQEGSVLMVRNGYMAVDKVDSRTRRGAEVEQSDSDVSQYLSDGYGNIRLRVAERFFANRNTGMRRVHYRLLGRREWQLLSVYNYVDQTGFVPVALDRERNSAYGYRKKDGYWALYRIALDGSMREELVYERPNTDIVDLLSIGRRHRVIGARYGNDLSEAVYFDPALEKLRAGLAKALPKQPVVQIVDSSADEKKLLIFAGSDDDPGVYYILDRTTHEMAIFHPVRPELEGMTLAKAKAVSYPAADGTMISAYLTLPPGGATKGLPAIMIPRVGPNHDGDRSFDWLAQYYAARGFAVLQPKTRDGINFFGELWFDRAGFTAWERVVGDFLAGGRWLISQGIADPAKLAAVGWGTAGYTVLQSAVVDPYLFKAVVGIAPVTDLSRLKEQSLGWSSYRLKADFIGSGPHIMQGSPARNAARLKVPVMLFHGARDNVVEIEQSTMMDARLQEAGVPHQLVVFDKLDHQLEDSDARARLLRESDAFLRKSMGM